MLTISPGPLPFDDGDRITVERDLAAFVNGTDVTNIGRTELRVGQILEFVSSQTEPPPLAERGRGTIWFERGAGILWKWQYNPTGATGGRWIQMSDRRERLAHTKNGCAAGELLWLGHGSGEHPAIHSVHGDPLLSVEATPADNPAVTRSLFIPPFVVALEAADAGSFVRVAESGFVDVQFEAATPVGTQAVGKADPNANPRLDLLTDPWTHPIADQGLGYMATSLASIAAGDLVRCFFFGDGTNLTL